MLPDDYTLYCLCKMLHKTPTEIEDEDAEQMERFAAYRNAEIRDENIRREQAAKKPPPKKR